MLEWAVTSSVLVFVVLALRRCLMGKISLRLQYALWALVLVRLLVPVSFGATAMSILNLVENANIANPVVGYMGGHTIQLSISEPDPTLPLEEQQKQYEENLEQWQAEMDADRAENGTPTNFISLYQWSVLACMPASEYMQETTSIFILLLLGFSLCIVITSLICWFRTRALIKPLKAIGVVAENFAKGKLDADISRTSNDEIGDLEETFAATQINLKNIISDIAVVVCWKA